MKQDERTAIGSEIERLYGQRKLNHDEYRRLRRLYGLDAQTRPASPSTGRAAALQQPTLATTRFCPNCAVDLSGRPEARHCPSCGVDLQAQPTATAREAVASTAGYCQSCGASLKPNSSFCGSCGSTAMPPKPSIAVETPMPTYCAECGAQLKPGSSFCGKCGTRISRQG